MKQGRQVRLGAALVLACSLVAFALDVPAGDAASAPTAYTGEAAEVTYSSASLKGSVYPGDEQTSYYFEYGPTNAYGAQTPTTSAGGGTQTIHVSAAITGLTIGSAYHYRLVAVSSLGTTRGQDRTFTTKKVPLTFTVAALPSRDLFASPFSVAGTLSGTGSPDHEVVLEANPFPYLAGFKAVGPPESTDAAGRFSFSVPGLTQNTQLRVATLDTPPINSRVMVELVAVRVTLHVRRTGRRGFARLYGTVTPGEPGAQVGFQLLRAGHRPMFVSSTIITQGGRSISHFGRVVPIRRAGLYRASVEVTSGAQVSNYSRAILIA